MPRVIVSSGHTTKSPGTVANGLKEVDIARKIAKATLPHLRQNGVITLSVPPDMDLFQRLEWINKSGYDENTGDIAIEIHINDGGDSGVEAWYEGEGDTESKKLTDTILEAVSSESGLDNKGSNSEYDHDLVSIAFLHEVHPIASLIECGYIDNEKDAEFLKDDKNIAKLGKGIAKGVLKYLNIEYREAQMPASNTSQPSVQAQPTTKSIKPRVRPASNAASATPPAANNIPVPNNGGMGAPAAGLGAPGGGMGIGATGAGLGAGAGGAMPSREDRKEMINKYYVKILGREPNQNDLNYFLNIGIKEDELIKKMIDSQEHADLVKARKDVIETKQKYNEQQTELKRLKAYAEDTKKIINNLQNSIQQKNQMYAQIQHKMNSIYYQQKERERSTNTNAPASTKYTGSFLDKLFKAFSDVFE